MFSMRLGALTSECHLLSIRSDPLALSSAGATDPSEPRQGWRQGQSYAH